MEIGQRIKELRKTNKLTMEQLADVLNNMFPNEDGSKSFGKGTISKWENNRVDPAFSSMIKLSKYFNIPLDYLSAGDIDENESSIPKNMIYLELGKTTYLINKDIEFKSGNTGLFKIPDTENAVIRKGQLFDGNILLTEEKGEQNLYKSNEVELIGVVVSKEIKMI
ncbi:helix-turn-helix domain-containing protein [Staphylococcus pseudoxylosus]|uniref:XRE family transcriptional regulator n=1 Tax=Staphylococcus pseudoxylosus TaxID=2282419 RepID=A0AAQ0MKQ7_9STAP|nr:helix-turn-helix transcriptional regulator [Staphylococcus pseudoxylosus]MCE5003541.1 helix-turn-helix transcriptional regulator [Staphylococcus pseudoxylosus]RMI85581.1 XRE family transcriptional regulator [Staphylococcus pseudoxylosus]